MILLSGTEKQAHETAKSIVENPSIVLNKTIEAISTIAEGIEKAIKPLELTNPKTVKLKYLLHGKEGEIKFTTYESLYQHLKYLERDYTCYEGSCPSEEKLDKIFLDRFLEEPNQKKEIQKLAEIIQNLATDEDDQARIAISLVQNIPYDYQKYNKLIIEERYPYEVLYDGKGICGEKSKLLVLLLKELGYGTAVFDWKGVHQAVGVKCPENQQFKSGYCFIEVANPAIPTYKPTHYGLNGEVFINNNPKMRITSSGEELDLQEEYQDGKSWGKILGMGQVIPPGYYNQFMQLSKKYGIELQESGTIYIYLPSY